ncbi:hypothetical protein D3C87_984650 [compost metagenome]|uniref:hypothetical protein n=1 Tax=Pedobacter ghigonis TaxID=2730403 RepID=UPI000FB9961C|nr:hypothetical protein [Pedobacter ghigonis]
MIIISDILKRPALYLSVGLFVFSLTRPALIIETGNGLKSDESFLYFIIGSIAILGGGTSEFLVWLANPLYFISLFLLIKNRKGSIYFIIIANFLAISFLRWKEILISESGSTGKIISFSSGYYLWVASIVVLLFVSICQLKKDPTSPKEVSNH